MPAQPAPAQPASVRSAPVRSAPETRSTRPVVLLAGPGELPGEDDLVRLAGAHDHEVAWLGPGRVPSADVLDRVEVLVPPLPHLLDADGRGVFARLPRLRLLQVLSSGTDWIPALAASRGAAVASSAGVADASVAELTLALLLASRRELGPHAAAVACVGWEEDRVSPGLHGSRVVLVGQGGVGRAVGRLLAPFDATLDRVARTRRATPEGVVHALDALPDLLPSADVVILAVPLTPATSGLLDARLLALLPAGALVVNVGRGALVDTDALTAEVASGRLRAALDVVDPDPLPGEHPLRRLPGALVTPHVGRNTPAVRERQAALLRDQLERHLTGRPLVNLL